MAPADVAGGVAHLLFSWHRWPEGRRSLLLRECLDIPFDQ